MHWLDTTILVVLGVGATFGAISGLLMQVARVVGLSAGIGAAVYLHDWATHALQEHVLKDADPRVTAGLAYVLVFVVVFLACHLTTLMLERGLKAVKLQTMNRVLGGVLGAVKTALLLGGVFLALHHFPHPQTTEVTEKSAIAPVLAGTAETILWMTVPPDQFEAWRAEASDWRSILKVTAKTD